MNYRQYFISFTRTRKGWEREIVHNLTDAKAVNVTVDTEEYKALPADKQQKFLTALATQYKMQHKTTVTSADGTETYLSFDNKLSYIQSMEL